MAVSSAISNVPFFTKSNQAVSDDQRLEQMHTAMREAGFDAVICGLPINILLLTGYWPVVGNSIAVVGREGPVVLITPQDESELARKSWADRVLTYSPGSLDALPDDVEMVREPLRKAAKYLGDKVRNLGYESGPIFQPFTYGAIHLYGESLGRLLCAGFPSASLVAADAWLARLQSVKTDRELEHLRIACRVARRAFEQGAAALRVGMSEAEVAHAFAGPLSIDGLREPGVSRAGGFVYCMSGPNSAEAGAAYAHTRARRIQHGDLVLVHCNSYVDGYWTDITRTYSLGSEVDRAHKLMAAVLEARDAALSIIRPGVAASAVDAAARQILRDRGFGRQFTHGTGHGVGFAAIDHLARPRLHPASDEMLIENMVFNVEPAIYIEGLGGMRHCDMVAVTATGAELLTPFQTRCEDMLISIQTGVA